MAKKIRKSYSSKFAYIGLSMAFAILLTHTIPFEYLTTIELFGHYILNEKLQNIMVWLLPAFALIGALITIRIRTAENLMLNAFSGFTILLIMRSLQNYLFFTAAALVVLTAAIFLRSFDLYCEDPELSWPVFQKIYRSFRRIFVYGVIIALTPLSLWTAHNEVMRANRIMESINVSAEQTKAFEHTALADLLVTETDWRAKDVSSKRALIAKWAPAILNSLGVSNDDFRVEFVKENAGTLGAFTNTSDKPTIEINDAYLSKAGYSEEDVLNTVLHECYHYYEEKAVEMYDQLLAMGYEADRMPDLERIKNYKDAGEQYISAYDNFDKYSENYLEREARAYAENVIAELHSCEVF